ncbi:hypothetical protein JCM11641_001098 [Rhodosporidiobolus odoratus]
MPLPSLPLDAVALIVEEAKPEVFNRVAPYISELELEGGALVQLPMATATLAKLAAALTAIHLHGTDLFHPFSLSMLHTPSALSTRLRCLAWTCHSDGPVSLNPLLILISQLSSLYQLTILMTVEVPFIDVGRLLTAVMPTRLPVIRTLKIGQAPSAKRLSQHQPFAAPSVSATISASFSALLNVIPTFSALSRPDRLALHGPLPLAALQRLLNSAKALCYLALKFYITLRSEDVSWPRERTALLSFVETRRALLSFFAHLLPS